MVDRATSISDTKMRFEAFRQRFNTININDTKKLKA